MLNSWVVFIFFVVFQGFFPQPAYFKHVKIKKNFVKLPSISPSEQNKTLERVFTALEGLLDFYKREHKNLNVDGAFGLRVLEGVAKKIIVADKIGEIYIPRRLLKRVKRLQSKSTQIANMSIYYMKKDNPQYFDVMGFTVVEAWDNIKPLRNLDLNENVPHSILNKSDNQIKMKESKQDQCFRGLAGDKVKGLQPCRISEYCWKVNTAQGKSEYYLTHQLLYFLMGQVKGCSKVFEAKLKSDSFEGGVDKFLSQSCQLMYPEMLNQETKAKEQQYLEEIDLYMEQGVVCGMLGYVQFLSLYRLDLILGWMHPRNGCFGFHGNVRSDSLSHDGEEEDEDDNEKNDENKKAMRQLKVAKDLKGGCELHSSAVGTGLLALYLRWLLHISSMYTPGTKTNMYNEAGFFIKHRYLGIIPSVKTTLFFVIIVILILLVIAKRMLGFRVRKSLWM